MSNEYTEAESEHAAAAEVLFLHKLHSPFLCVILAKIYILQRH